jgi:hypothetical protein
MNSVRTISLLAVAAVISLIVASCSSKVCYDETDPEMNVLMLADGTGTALEADSLRVTGIVSLELTEFVEETDISTFSLPLDPTSDVSTFFIKINDITDTVTITYSRMPHLVSPECGYTIVSDITGLTSTQNIIDTLIVENKSVNLDGKTNLRLFY